MFYRDREKMSNLEEKIKIISQELEKNLQNPTTLQDIEILRINFLGKKGKITLLMPELKKLLIENKKKFGPILNELKKEAEKKNNKSKRNIHKKTSLI